MNLNPIDLGNGILLFKNVFKDKEKVYEFIKNSKTSDDPYFGKDVWKDWQPWGNYAKAYPMQNHSYKNDPSYAGQLCRTANETAKRIQKINQVLQKEDWKKHCDVYDYEAAQQLLLDKLIHTNATIFEIMQELNQLNI